MKKKTLKALFFSILIIICSTLVLFLIKKPVYLEGIQTVQFSLSEESNDSLEERIQCEIYISFPKANQDIKKIHEKIERIEFIKDKRTEIFRKENYYIVDTETIKKKERQSCFSKNKTSLIVRGKIGSEPFLFFLFKKMFERKS